MTVKFFAHLRILLGTDHSLEVDVQAGDNISHLLEEICRDPRVNEILRGTNNELKADITILKNGREIKFLKGLETSLEEGDEIAIFPMVAGGTTQTVYSQ